MLCSLHAAKGVSFCCLCAISDREFDSCLLHQTSSWSFPFWTFASLRAHTRNHACACNLYCTSIHSTDSIQYSTTITLGPPITSLPPFCLVPALELDSHAPASKNLTCRTCSPLPLAPRDGHCILLRQTTCVPSRHPRVFRTPA